MTDAILGALNLPDIGQIFPDTDPKWKGCNSDVFVKEAVRLMHERGYQIGNIGALAAPSSEAPVGPIGLLARQVCLLTGSPHVVLPADCTIIAQRPKLSPHKENIRGNLATMLGVHPSVVNIKVRRRYLGLARRVEGSSPSSLIAGPAQYPSGQDAREG